MVVNLQPFVSERDTERCYYRIVLYDYIIVLHVHVYVYTVYTWYICHVIVARRGEKGGIRRKEIERARKKVDVYTSRRKGGRETEIFNKGGREEFNYVL